MYPEQSLLRGLECWYPLQSKANIHHYNLTFTDIDVWPNYHGHLSNDDPGFGLFRSHALASAPSNGANPSESTGPGYGLPIAYDFDDAEQDRLLPVAGGAAVGTGYSMACWVYFTTITNTQGILGPRVFPASAGIYFDTADDRIKGEFAGLGSANFGPTQINAAVAATWYHVVVTYVLGTSVADMWINGVIQTQYNGTGSWTGTPDPFLHLGWHNSNAGNDYGFLDGRLAGCGAWSRQLQQHEVLWLYNKGQGLNYPFMINRNMARAKVLRGGRPSSRRTIR